VATYNEFYELESIINLIRLRIRLCKQGYKDILGYEEYPAAVSYAHCNVNTRHAIHK